MIRQFRQFCAKKIAYRHKAHVHARQKQRQTNKGIQHTHKNLHHLLFPQVEEQHLKHQKEQQDWQQGHRYFLHIVRKSGAKLDAQITRAIDLREYIGFITGGRCVIRQAENQHGEDRPDGAQRDHTEAIGALLPGLTDGRKAKAKSHNERHSHRPGSHAAGIKGHGEELLRHEECQRKHNCVANDQNNGQIPAKERSQERDGEECAHAAGHRQDEHKVRHSRHLACQHLQVRFRDGNNRADEKAHDGNDDGFVDIPQVEQYNVWNRWAYMGDHYVFQAGFKALSETRSSGQSTHGDMYSGELYKVGIDTERYELFTKNAYIFDKEKNTNLALILSTSWHNQDAMYGRKLYNVDQTNTYASLMFETEFNPQNSFSAGLSFNYDAYDQHYRLNNNADTPLKASDKEAVPGAYVQYTLNLNDQWMLMAGLRGDYSSKHGFFVTPRAHLKYNPNDYVHFRLSAGKGYRTNHVLAENNYLLSSSRKVEIAKNLDMEEAWNLGASVSTYIPVFGKTLNVNAEYYYTDFRKQVVVDMDSNPHEVAFYNLDGRSYSHVFQVEASYPFFKGFTLTGAYRLTDAQTTYKGQRMEKPLTGKYKGLLTASYQTPLGIWQFDATLQLNGGGRMPAPYELADGQLSWSRRYGSFEQLSMQVTRYFRRWSIYVGGENLTNFKQKNPIIDAANPWGDNFDSTMIWGPVHGAKAYVGIRFNLARNGE